MIDLILAAALTVTPVADRPARVVIVRPPRAVVQVVIPERERRQIFRDLFERFRNRRR